MIIWRAYHLFSSDYYAERVENGVVTERMNLHSHCLQCAKIDIMSETGEPADIRGWHRAGMCGAFAKTMRMTIDAEEVNDDRHK